MKDKKKLPPLIMLTAGGTGGHVFPADALAEELSKRGYRLLLVTDKRGLNNYKGKLGEIPNYAVQAGALMGKSRWFKIKSLFKTSVGILQSMWLILRFRPACVVGFGGYASFPCSLAATLLGIDLVIHEQNSVMSRTNRLLAKHAELIATSFRKTKFTQIQKNTVLTGMPIRKSISDLYDEKFSLPSENGIFNLIVLGGSQGAKIFADIVPGAVAKISTSLQQRLNVVQQCRQEDIEGVKDAYKKTKCKLVISNFFDNMPELYKSAHLIISRSGASSVSEIAAAGIPSILVPLPTAADDHQTTNAEDFKQNKGGYVIAQKDFQIDNLSIIITNLLNDEKKLEQMSNNTKKFAIIDAAERLANQIENKIIRNKK